MGGLDQEKNRNLSKQGTGDQPHQRPLRTEQEHVDHQSEAVMTPGASFGEIPGHEEKADGGKSHMQRPLQKRDNVDDLQSEATVTPGAFSVDSVSPPYGDDDPFDNGCFTGT
jgi:hypothetical protein